MMKQQTDKDDPAFTPMAVFYKGLERQWATFAVYVMAMKLLLTFVATSYRGQMVLQAGLTTVAAAAWLVLSKLASPFIKDHCDREDIGAKASQLVTALLGIWAASSYCSGQDAMASGIIIQVITTLCLIGFALAIVKQQPWYKQRQKDKRGILLFSDYCPSTHHSSLKTQHDAPLIYDIQREKKPRVWHPFLDMLFMELVGGSVNDGADDEQSDEPAIMADEDDAENEEASEKKSPTLAAGEAALKASSTIKKMKSKSNVDPADKAVVKRWKFIKYQVQQTGID